MALLLDLYRFRDSCGEHCYEVWSSPDTWSGSQLHRKNLAVEPSAEQRVPV
jgi:hypothetical protein